MKKIGIILGSILFVLVGGMVILGVSNINVEQTVVTKPVELTGK